MSNSALPPEILDYILDLLHDDPESLKQCCLVANSWVPRTRRHLFAYIRFHAAHILQSWSNTFPDPTNSPAPHVRTLEIDCRPGDLEGVDWIRSFSYVVKLRLEGRPTVPFALLHGLSHNLKSLQIWFIEFSCSELFRFICSFPLLENLDFVGQKVLDDENDLHGLQTSPPLTGSFKLIVFNGGIRSIVRHLLNLPSSLRFRELELLLVTEDDHRWLNELVLRCSDTLECLDIRSDYSTTPNFIDLSQVTKLKVLKVQPMELSPERLTMLETITAEHLDLRQISIHLLPKYMLDGDYFGDDIYERWLVLDRLLVRLWESYSIRTNMVVRRGNQEMEARIGSLFPEMTARGIVDITEEY